MVENIFSVKLRNGFSDRNNIKPINTAIQHKALDERTRVALINATNVIYNATFEGLSNDTNQSFLKNLLKDVYVIEIDYSNSYNQDKVFQIINNTIRVEDYDSVLTLIEYLAEKFDELLKWKDLKASALYNSVFEKEYVGYRIINGCCASITNDEEQKSIVMASKTKYSKVNQFLAKATKLISDRKNTDYENSIKESISAVEEMCNTILGKKSSLGTALDKLETAGLKIHPCLKGAFDKLYGYTSDASGIRHAGQIDGKSATFEEARFMLVTCSAFINYLLGNFKS